MKYFDLEEAKKYLVILWGSLLSCIGINCFIVPMNLYNGGTIGIAQIIRTLLSTYGNVAFSFDIAGIINFGLNIPLFFLAYSQISKRFFLRTVFSVATQTIFFTLITLSEPIITDRLTSCIIGGIFAAYGVGITLRAGGSGGGFDILGVYYAKKSKGGSVGQLSGVLNACIYAVCAILFELPTAIYSVIYSFISSLVVDKVHTQNISISAIIITKVPNLQAQIVSELNRGVTCWKGIGGYTDQDVFVLMTVLSKFETDLLRRKIQEVDPNAFIIIHDKLDIFGNYEKRL